MRDAVAEVLWVVVVDEHARFRVPPSDANPVLTQIPNSNPFALALIMTRCT